ncbi:MAG: hypothetical protein OXB88_03400 [Bacteriovoracales bacterium]|nr:hypothetical protein [Bacteriovoracales bacterium]
MIFKISPRTNVSRIGPHKERSFFNEAGEIWRRAANNPESKGGKLKVKARQIESSF